MVAGLGKIRRVSTPLRIIELMQQWNIGYFSQCFSHNSLVSFGKLISLDEPAE